jgi:hypothetical protein
MMSPARSQDGGRAVSLSTSGRPPWHLRTTAVARYWSTTYGSPATVTALAIFVPA